MSRESGILLVDKPKGISSFTLVRILRRLTGVKKIGHAGTLDPFATGVMVMLIGRDFTRLSDQLLGQDKEYVTCLRLGATTDTYDSEGRPLPCSDRKPSLSEIEAVLSHFQGEIEQVPPMFSAKKIAGKKLYELARKGQTVERPPVRVKVNIDLLSYSYPELILRVACSKGTYIRSLGHDIGQKLGTGAYLTELQRVRSGPFLVSECVDGKLLDAGEIDVTQHLRRCA